MQLWLDFVNQLFYTHRSISHGNSDYLSNPNKADSVAAGSMQLFSFTRGIYASLLQQSLSGACKRILKNYFPHFFLLQYNLTLIKEIQSTAISCHQFQSVLPKNWPVKYDYIIMQRKFCSRFSSFMRNTSFIIKKIKWFKNPSSEIWPTSSQRFVGTGQGVMVTR